MTIEQRLERDLPEILGELAAAPYPDYIDDVLSTTAGRGQRPRWAFPERWLPMDLVSTRVPTTRLPWRQFGVLALIAILLGAALAVYIGAQTPRVPPPFGLARNGKILFVDEGRIYVSDSLRSSPRVLVGGNGGIAGVQVSQDGRRISYVDDGYRGGQDLFVASIDGAGQQKLNDDPLFDIDRIAWSPDGSRIAVSHVMWNVQVISVFATDGSGGRLLDTGGLIALSPAWRPPDGNSLLFRGEKENQVDLYLMDPQGSNVRPLNVPQLTTGPGATMYGPVWSPDGTRIAYHTEDLIDPENGTGSWQTHVYDVVKGKDITLPSKTLVDQHDTDPIWSPDGAKILTQRWIAEKAGWMAVLPADGSGPGVDLDLRNRAPGSWRGEFSPDGTLVLAFDDETHQALTFDPATGKSTPLDWAISDLPTFQRVAR